MWETLVNLVCRPPRFIYDPDSCLGPKKFRIMGKVFERQDVQVRNRRGQTLQCSHFIPSESPRVVRPCVIYCHGNCGSRADAADCLDLLLPNGITVFAFDFSGSGLSDGETISLGYYEKDDLAAVVQYLRMSGLVSRIGLWGRSMGAATSILYAASDPSIAGMVLDSSFSSLTNVMHELAGQYIRQVKLPKMLINGAISVLRKSVQKRANFDIKQVNPLGVCGSCFIPALFAHADGDDFVLPTHSAQLYEQYLGDKNRITFAGDHNSPRPAFFFDSVGIFFYNTLLDMHEQGTAYTNARPPTGRSWEQVAVPPALPDANPQHSGGVRGDVWSPPSSRQQSSQQQQQQQQQGSSGPRVLQNPMAQYQRTGEQAAAAMLMSGGGSGIGGGGGGAEDFPQTRPTSYTHSPPHSSSTWGDTAAAAAAFSPGEMPLTAADEEQQMLLALKLSLQEMTAEYGNGDENVAELEKILDEYVIVPPDSPIAQQYPQHPVPAQRLNYPRHPDGSVEL